MKSFSILLNNEVKLPLSQIVLVCLLLRDGKEVPPNVQLTKSKQSLEANLKLVAQIFALVGWTFPASEVKEMVRKKLRGEVDEKVDSFL